MHKILFKKINVNCTILIQKNLVTIIKDNYGFLIRTTRKDYDQENQFIN